MFVYETFHNSALIYIRYECVSKYWYICRKRSRLSDVRVTTCCFVSPAAERYAESCRSRPRSTDYRLGGAFVAERLPSIQTPSRLGSSPPRRSRSRTDAIVPHGAVGRFRPRRYQHAELHSYACNPLYERPYRSGCSVAERSRRTVSMENRISDLREPNRVDRRSQSDDGTTDDSSGEITSATSWF